MRQAQNSSQSPIQKGKFLARASHDLRQPLQALSLFHTTLHNRHAHSSPHIFANMDAARRHLSSMFNNLLDMSMIQSNGVRTTYKTVDLADLVSDLMSGIELPQPFNRTRLSVILPEYPVHVRTDPVLITRILGNIVFNALKFAPDSFVKVALQERDNTVDLTVTDHGPGIAADALPRIFNDYEKADDPDTQVAQQNGLGLGLTIVRELCDELEIALGVSSQLGQGTRFKLEIPRLP